MPTVAMPAIPPSLRGTLSGLAGPLAALEVAVAAPHLEDSEGGGGATVAVIFIVLLAAVGVGGFFWMQRRERMIQAYAEEEARMRSSIPEMQARIDQQVDLEVAAASAVKGASLAVTAATLPRASEPALAEPPPAPKMSLPGCGPIPGVPSAPTSRASFAASASRRSVISTARSEYTLGDDRPSVMATRTSRSDVSSVTPPVSETGKRTSTQRGSVAALAESRKSLVEVMKMYGPEEEKGEGSKSRSFLWYSEDKKTDGGDGDTSKRGSLNSWYNDGKEAQTAPPDPSKVVSMDQGKEGDEAMTVPSTVAHDLTEKSEKVEDGEAAPEAKEEATAAA